MLAWKRLKGLLGEWSGAEGTPLAPGCTVKARTVSEERAQAPGCSSCTPTSLAQNRQDPQHPPAQC